MKSPSPYFLVSGGLRRGLAVVALALVSCGRPADDGRAVKMYQSPMHPWIVSDQPGSCTICGMALVPVYEGEEGFAEQEGVVALSQSSVTVLGVATVPARRMELTKTLRFSGVLEDDENLHRIIAAFYDGRIEKIYVEQVGKYVEKGAPLAAIYSPELLYVLREYQSAVRGGEQAVARNTAQRLVQFGLTAEQVSGLARQSGEVYTIDLLAPISGTVLAKQAYQGQYLKTGEPLFEMGDLSRLWFHAEVYERDLADIRIGQPALLRTPSVPGREFPGVVTFIDPNFDSKTRSTRVRIEVDNPLADSASSALRRMLPHRAYAEADLSATLGDTLVVPRSAVLRDGRRSVAYVETSPGVFAQRMVKVGRTGNEGVQILDGIAEGEKVVVEGNLMIDAEAQLRSSSVAPQPAAGALPAPVGEKLLRDLAAVAEALAKDDAVAAVAAGRELRREVQGLADTGEAGVDAALAKLRGLIDPPSGSDLKALRRSFLPWSEAGSELALAVARAGQPGGVVVFECPMTSDSFPGAPAQARWVQEGREARNPYFGAGMLNCGGEVRP